MSTCLQQTVQTVKQWLRELSVSTTSTQQDGERMAKILRNYGLPEATVVDGRVYIDGGCLGQNSAPPVSLHRMAQMLLIKVDKS